MSVALEVWNQASMLTPLHSSGGSGVTHHILADGQFPDPPAQPLPGKAQQGVNYFIGTLKTLLYVAATVAGLFLALAMIAGFRGRSNFAKDAVTHMPWLFGALVFAGTLTALLSKFA